MYKKNPFLEIHNIFKHLIFCRYYPADAETLLAAFNVLDEDGKHHISKEKFSKLILEEGEPFTEVLTYTY